MRKATNPNYIKFGKYELILQFTKDLGELRTNTYGEFFFRETMDGRFCCAAPELERRLIDAGYTANQRVGITKATHNRIGIWKVRLIDPPVVMNAPRISETPAPSPATAPRPRQPVARTAPIPESKYASAPPAPAWPEVESPIREALDAPAPTKPAARAAEVHAAPINHTGVSACLKACLCAAIDAVRDAHAYAAAAGFPIKFQEPEIQAMAVSLYIQNCKEANMNRIDRDRGLRANGGGDAWRH